MKTPSPIFDTADNTLVDSSLPSFFTQHAWFSQDYRCARSFLYAYKENIATFNAYRREIERLLLWAWLLHEKSILSLKRADIDDYLKFCQKPPVSWIGVKKVAHFVTKNALKVANPQWRPFVATVKKSAAALGELPDVKTHHLADKSFREIFSVLSSFYNFLIQENLTELNPILQIRQKSKYLRKVQATKQNRRLSELQWAYVIETAEQLATVEVKHQRTFFIMSALYGMYLRISELTASKRWTPKMADFTKDQDGHWWFTTVGKGNKERQIAVSDAMLQALKIWRSHLNVSPLPVIGDDSPLIPKERGVGPITSTNQIRNIVQYCFDQTVLRMQHAGFVEEAESLKVATVHWLRHTGISDDVKVRPREHVRDDAGHSSSAITDKYIDIELRARHASAKKKMIK